MKKKIYTVATAHLDTSWLWTQEETVRTYLPRTLKYNFAFFEKYPEYKFNFEGAYRYELMEEYYPEEFKKLQEYVKSGNWNVCGSCYENGDTNIPSPEALIRNILYGNSYFQEKFGVRSNDIFLPDCFGFGRALPSIASHCGLKGFSTQKLSWGSTVPVPFEFGKWTGPDGGFLYCSLKPGQYEGIVKDARSDAVLDKINENEKSGMPFTMVYHGTGDRGGSPSPESVKNVVSALRENGGNDTDVLSSAVCKVFEDMDALPEDVKAKMPVWDGEFLMSEHGAGSYTTRTQSKRFNRQSEVLGDVSERAGTAAMLLGKKEYPQAQLDFAWKKTIQHQFHDDITGTSFMKCYLRNWNDYVQALNTFSTEYVSAVKAVAEDADTSGCEGVPVLVFNGAQDGGAFTVSLPLPVSITGNVRVFASDGSEVPSQLCGGQLIFSAPLRGSSFTLFDVRPSSTGCGMDTGLRAAERSLENNRYRVLLNEELDICSVYDKSLCRELLSAPVRLQLLRDIDSVDWPAWEVKYSDLMREPYACPAPVSCEIVENGPARAALSVTKKYGESTFTQIISLGCGADRVDVFNEVDWSLEASDLKIAFPLSVSDTGAYYDIGIGAYKRQVNTEKQFEVPAQRWAGICSDGCGIYILSDSRTGWDMPDDHTLRLTAIHTPLANYRWENSQHLADMGINRFSFSICSGAGKFEEATAEAERFSKGADAFIAGKHAGSVQGGFSLLTVSDEKVRVMAVKKAMGSDGVILRVCDYSGKGAENVRIDFIKPVKSACLVRGDEEYIADFEVTDGGLCFDMKPGEIKSFRLCFDTPAVRKKELMMALPYNARGITPDSDRRGGLKGGVSFPRELLPETVYTNGVHFRMADGERNVLRCCGQTLEVPEGFSVAHILITSLAGDKTARISGADYPVQDAFERLGVWDMVGLNVPGYIKKQPQALSLSHHHKDGRDEVLAQTYFYDVAVPVDCGKLTLPEDDDLIILAVTLTDEKDGFSAPGSLFDALEKRELHYSLSDYARKKAAEPLYQKVIDLVWNRVKTYRIHIFGGYSTQSMGDAFSLVDQKANRKYRKSLDGKAEK